jgi:hypothetical protein
MGRLLSQQRWGLKRPEIHSPPINAARDQHRAQSTPISGTAYRRSSASIGGQIVFLNNPPTIRRGRGVTGFVYPNLPVI